MDKYQYDELSMALGFAHFAADLVAPARPVVLTARPTLSRGMRWVKVGHFHLSDDEADSPLIIDGPVYTDDEIVKLDLFHRARSNTISFDEKSADGVAEDVSACLPLPVPVGIVKDDEVSSHGSKETSPHINCESELPSDATICPERHPVVVQPKAHMQNLLASVVGRQRLSGCVAVDEICSITPVSAGDIASKEHVYTDHDSTRNSLNYSTPAPSHVIAATVRTDQNAQLRNMLMAGLAARQKPAEPTPPTATTALAASKRTVMTDHPILSPSKHAHHSSSSSSSPLDNKAYAEFHPAWRDVPALHDWEICPSFPHPPEHL